MSQDPYEILGVTELATPAELKKAYYRKIKAHPPETDPEGFKRIQRAYETAADPEYLVIRRHGDEIKALMDEAGELMSKEQWPDAMRKLKRVIVLHDGASSAWNLLGICHSRSQEWEEAKRTYVKLLKRSPDSILYRINYAYVFISEANATEGNPALEAQLGRQARDQLDIALRLEPNNPDVLDTYAHTYSAHGDWPNAIVWTEKALAAEKTPDPAKYLFLARMYHLSGRKDEVVEVAERLLERLPDDPDAREYAAREFALFAIKMYKAHLFPVAHPFLSAAVRIDPSNEKLNEIAEEWDNIQEACDEWDEAKDDPEIIPPVRYLLAVFTDEARNLEFDEPRDEIFEKIKNALDTWEGYEIANAACRVRVEYPHIYRLNPEVIDDLEGAGDGPTPTPAPPPPEKKGLFERIASWFS